MPKQPLNSQLLLHLYDAALIKRWNDQVRTADFRELDKQAHKFIIAYLIGKSNRDKTFDWPKLIEAGLFEFFHRLSLTDLKPQLFHRITQDHKIYKNVIAYSRKKLELFITDTAYLKTYEDYFLKKLSKPTIYNRIMDAANFMASREEFTIIKEANPNGFGINTIERQLDSRIREAMAIKGVTAVEKNKNLREFIKLCGQLRFQIRWSQTYRVPETSVLGHMLMVAIITHLCTTSFSNDKQVVYNNFFTALFHDLPEALTRDILSPIKRIDKMSDLVKKYENEEMERVVYPLLPKMIQDDIRFFTKNEFSVAKNGATITRHGDLIKAIDELTAYIEAYLALKNGIHNDTLSLARSSLANKYHSTTLYNINFGSIYQCLEKTI